MVEEGSLASASQPRSPNGRNSSRGGGGVKAEAVGSGRPRAIEAARDQWPSILTNLGGIDSVLLDGRPHACPICLEGEDRFTFDNKDGTGSWICRQCPARPGKSAAAGRGMDLLMAVTRLEFKAAAQAVENFLGLPSTTTSSRPTRATTPRKGKRPHRIPTAPPLGTPPPPLDGASMQWCYADADGAPLFWIQRVETATGKLFIHRTWLDDTWHRPSRRDGFASDWPAPRPLYRLPALRQQPDAPVLMAEGEKAADAAAFLFPDHACLGWANGTSNLSKVDWAPLAGRDVTLWPDADNTGQEAMAALAPRLLALGCSVSIVLPPTRGPADWDLVDAPGAHGWDLADATWTEQQAADYLINNARTVELPQQQEQALGPALEQAQAQPMAQGGQRAAGAPFTVLGWDAERGKGLWYQHHRTGQIARVAASSGMHMLRLAPLAYWEMLYPGQKGVNWFSAVSDVGEQADAAGVFMLGSVRGRGIWTDKGRTVWHLGDRLLVDGADTPLSGHNSVHVYARMPALAINPAGPALTDQQGGQLLQVVQAMGWGEDAHPLLLLGWIVCGIAGGALESRPGLQITSHTGSGKSTVYKTVMGPLFAGAIHHHSGSTGAGIRQLSGADALPVVVDETEAGEDNRNREQVLRLMRYSYNGDPMVKGTTHGEATLYAVRFALAVLAVNGQITEATDRNRIAQLSRRPIPLEQWLDVEARLQELVTPDTGAALHRRIVANLPTLLANIRTIRRALAAHAVTTGGGSIAARMADTYGPLLAGAFLLVSTDRLDVPSATEWLGACNWQQELAGDVETELGPEAEGRSLLALVLAHEVPWRDPSNSDPGTGRKSVAELIELGRLTGCRRRRGSALETPGTAAMEALGSLGLRPTPEGLLVANPPEPLAPILRGTRWADGGHRARLRDLQGAEALYDANKVRILPGRGPVACSRLPWGLVDGV